MVVHRFLYDTMYGDDSLVSFNEPVLQKFAKSGFQERRDDHVGRRRWCVVYAFAMFLLDERELTT